LDLFHCLSFLDLKTFLSKHTKKIQNIDQEIKPFIRHPEAWSFCDYADNLTIALHICVALVRQTLGFSVVDHSISNGTCNEEKYFSKFNTIFNLQSGAIFELGSEKNSDDRLKKTLDELDNVFKATAKLWKDRLSFPNEKINVREIDLAFQFIFMLWLSKDVSDKQKKMNAISNPLQQVYVPFTDWLIEYNNQLYDPDWKLVLEPIIKPEDLREVYVQLENLWSYARDTDKDQIPFESLSAKLHQIDPAIINLMTDRLHNLLYLLPIYVERREETPETVADQFPNGHSVVNERGTETLKPVADQSPNAQSIVDEREKKTSKPYFFDDMLRARLIRKGKDLTDEYPELNCGHSFWSFKQDVKNGGPVKFADKDMEIFLNSFKKEGNK